MLCNYKVSKKIEKLKEVYVILNVSLLLQMQTIEKSLSDEMNLESQEKNIIESKYTYGKSGDERTYHFMQVSGESIEFCATEGDAQDQVNYHYNVLGRGVGYMETRTIPSKYMRTSPEGIDFILFDKETDIILRPVPKETIQAWINSIKTHDDIEDIESVEDIEEKCLECMYCEELLPAGVILQLCSKCTKTNKLGEMECCYAPARCNGTVRWDNTRGEALCWGHRQFVNTYL